MTRGTRVTVLSLMLALLLHGAALAGGASESAMRHAPSREAAPAAPTDTDARCPLPPGHSVDLVYCPTDGEPLPADLLEAPPQTELADCPPPPGISDRRRMCPNLDPLQPQLNTLYVPMLQTAP